jgi:phosphoadenosine phosphosulfate reductase
MNGILDVNEVNERLATASVEEVLGYFTGLFGSRVALASSLGLEDQVLTDVLSRVAPDARVFTLDTGRLFPETYRLIDRTSRRYGRRVEVFFPDRAGVEEMTREEGVNLFHESVEKRERCCRTRKLEPLSRAFSGLDAWICGVRGEQSATRAGTRLVEWDGANGLYKVSPLVKWSAGEVRAYVAARDVPYNRMHDEGFPSIGCEPCTRAVAAGDDPRSGRWWWEAEGHRECGLHRR